METLQKDILVKLSLDLDLKDLTRLCKTSKRINEIICNSRDFWSIKLFKDFGIRGGNPKIIYRKIVENREYCVYLNNISRDGIVESFLETIPSYIDEDTNLQFSDILVFNYLIMKYLKQDMGQPTLFNVTYDRYIKKYNTLYDDRITRGATFTTDEMQVLREIISRFRNLFSIVMTGDRRKQFLTSFLDQILKGTIPFETSLGELCKLNIY